MTHKMTSEHREFLDDHYRQLDREEERARVYRRHFGQDAEDTEEDTEDE